MNGVPVCFLLIGDEWGLFQATIFRSVYESHGNLLHHWGAFLLEGRVDRTRGGYFLSSCGTYRIWRKSWPGRCTKSRVWVLDMVVQV